MIPDNFRRPPLTVSYTSEGAIPFLRVNYAGGWLLAPPKTRGRKVYEGPGAVVPIKAGGLQVYVLPGGQEVVA